MLLIKKSIYLLLSFLIPFSFSFTQYGQVKDNNYYEIENIAKLHAKEDASSNGVLWGLGSFGASLLLSPLLGGGATSAIAYNVKGEVSVPPYRYSYVKENYGDDGFFI